MDSAAIEIEGPYAQGKLDAIHEILDADISGKQMSDWIDEVFAAPLWTYAHVMVRFRAWLALKELNAGGGDG